MKKKSLIVFICFIAVAVFFFTMKSEKGIPRAAAFKAKPIGEQPPLDSPELHRTFIKSGNSIIFESKKPEDNYELDEEELNMFIHQTGPITIYRNKVHISFNSEIISN